MIHRRSLLVASAVATALSVSPRASGAASATLRDPFDVVFGNPDGDVTVVEFFDFQCPYCKAGHPGVMRAVEEDGRTRLVMKDWPIFGPASLYAAQLALAARAEGSHAAAFAALMSTRGALDVGFVDGTLRDAGLDPDALYAAYRRDAVSIDRLLNATHATAQALDLNGTPSFIVGETVHKGVLDSIELTALIAAARS